MKIMFFRFKNQNEVFFLDNYTDNPLYNCVLWANLSSEGT